METCQCGATIPANHKGYRGICDVCSFHRKPTDEQQEKWDKEISFVRESDGELIRLQVVRRFVLTLC